MNRLLLANCILVLALWPELSVGDCGCNKANRAKPSEFARETNQNSNLRYDLNDESEEPLDASSKKLFRNDEDSPTDDELALIPGGTMAIGTRTAIFPEDKESPERMVTINDFYMDKYEVSNAKFMEFVRATGYATDAEKFGDSFVFKGVITAGMQEKYVDYRVASAPWWYKIDKVDWQHPEGVDSTIEGKIVLTTMTRNLTSLQFT